MIESIFPYIIPIHIGAVIATIAVIMYADSLALAWVRGERETLDAIRMHLLHRYVWYGLSMCIGTGLLLFYPYPEYLLTQTAFQFKIGFIAILILNGFFIGRLMNTAVTQSFSTLNQRKKMLLIISGGLSTVSWAGAIITATMLNL